MEEVGKRRLKIYDPIFGQEILVFLNYTAKEWPAVERRLGVTNPSEFNYNTNAFTTHISGGDEPNKYVLFIPNFQWTIVDQQTLIHEICHVVVRIWGANNIAFSPETQEFYAHSVDSIFGMIARKPVPRT